MTHYKRKDLMYARGVEWKSDNTKEIIDFLKEIGSAVKPEFFIQAMIEGYPGYKSGYYQGNAICKVDDIVLSPGEYLMCWEDPVWLFKITRTDLAIAFAIDETGSAT